jgi:hypothetical protein
VRHDNYPSETGWTLTDDSGTVVARQQRRNFATEELRWKLSSLRGSYTFEMTRTKTVSAARRATGNLVTLNGDTVSRADSYELCSKTFRLVVRVRVAAAPTPTLARLW